VEARRRTWFDDRGLMVEGGRRLPFYAASFSYWRVDRSRWASELRAIHALGVPLVETYVPWRVHEPDPGAKVWTSDRDLARFLDAAASAGLHVVLRPGPQIDAEIAGFGIPDWVLDEPACQARTAQDTPAWLPLPPRAFPIPSYASAAFRERVRAWYATVAEVVQSHLAPDGPVVAIGVDNDADLFYRLGAFDLDYHPDALGAWRDASGLDEPPRQWRADDAARCALWLKHKDDYHARALREFGRLLDDVGLGEIARFDGALTAYSSRRSFGELRRLATAHVTRAPLPLAFEVGMVPWLPPLEHADDPTRERDQLLSLLACGVRGFAVHAQPYLKSLVVALAEVDWPTLRRTPSIALVDVRADARFGLATSVLDPVTPVIADAAGLGAADLGTDTGAIAARRWHIAITRALELAHVPYAIVDEATSEDELSRYRAVIAPTHERIDRGLFQRLRALVDHKRAIVVIGPGTPMRDELDQPLNEAVPKRVGKLKAGSLEDLAGLAEDLAALAGEASDDWHVERPDDVRTMAFSDPEGAVKVVFVVSDSDRASTAVVLAASSLRDALTNELFDLTDGRISIPMPPRGVRMLLA